MALETTLGFLAAFVSILGWGSYFVPMKKLGKYDPFCFQVIMCTGIFILSLVFVGIFGAFNLSILGFLSGFLWAIGNILAVTAVKDIGLTRAAPIFMGVGMLTSFLLGLIFLQEHLTSILFGIAGIVLLMIGVNFVSLTSGSKKRLNIVGILVGIIAGIIFGTYLVPLKLSNLQPIEFLFPMSIGILITGWIIYLIKHPKIDKKIILPGFISGAIWNVANFSSFFAVLYLGISIGFPLTQTALLVSVVWGLLYFKEIKGRNKILKIIIGAILLLLGAVLLGIAK